MSKRFSDKAFMVVFLVAVFIASYNEASAMQHAVIDDPNVYTYENVNDIQEETYEDTEEYDAESEEQYEEEFEESYEDVEEYEEEVYYASYSDYDLYVLSHVIYGEASGCSWDMLIAVGSVVLNRVNDSRYPSTIADVVFQDGQYSCQSGGEFYRGTDDACTEAAIYLLEYGSQLPSYVVYQSQFVQGEGIYMTIGNTYFCY